MVDLKYRKIQHGRLKTQDNAACQTQNAGQYSMADSKYRTIQHDRLKIHDNTAW